MDCDNIIRSKPINKTAKLVTQTGIHFNSKKKIQVAEWDICPKLIGFKGHNNLIGVKFGTMTVVGKYDKKEMWVVHCICGKYTVRRAKSIKKATNNKDCCEMCRQFRYITKTKVDK